MNKKEHQLLLAAIFLSALAYLIGWQIPLLEIDAAQYANISREMLVNKQYLQIYDRGLDYLDKPPMLFWLSALSMRILGIHDWAYRLPSYLFALLSIFSTHRLARLFYSPAVALLSALVLASSQAMFLITHDVRTDTMLMGWVTFSLWQWARWYQSGSLRNFFWGTLGIAGGMMTKGPIALMVMVFAFLPHFALQRKWRQLFRWQYLLAALLIGLCLLPMDLGLYRQFDLHPEKIMYGKTGTSGLRFFYWTQSFGRITGESTWKENAHFFFLFENLLWGFLPWTLFFVAGLWQEFRGLIKNRFRIPSNGEGLVIGGFTLTYCALGISNYQLPHYIYVVLPLCAILTAKFLEPLLFSSSWLRWRQGLTRLHIVLFSLLGLALFALLYFPFPPPSPWLLGGFFAAIFLLFLFLRKHRLSSVLLPLLCVGSIVLLNVFVDTGFYPPLLQYQSGVRLSGLIRDQHLPKERIYMYKINEDRTLDFYSNHFFPHTQETDRLKAGDLIFTGLPQADSLDLRQFEAVDTIQDFHVSGLTLPFLNPKTRAAHTRPLVLLRKL